MRIDGSVALVTGGSRGIGRATALVLADAGAKVAVTARSLEDLEQTAATIRKRDRDAIALPADVTDRSQVDRVVAEVRSRLGAIDILVANAGTYVRRPALELSAADIETSLRVNFYAALHAILAVLPEMTAQRRGHLVLINSVDGRKALPGDGPYAVAKFALAGLGQVLRQELRPSGVGVSSVFPGRVDTEMISNLRVPRISRKVPPEKVAKAVLTAIRRNRSELVVPRLAVALLWADLASPALGDWIVQRLRLSGWET